jgi:hypothetical protein
MARSSSDIVNKVGVPHGSIDGHRSFLEWHKRRVLFYRFLSPETDPIVSMGQHFDSHSYQSDAVPQLVLVLIPAINLMSRTGLINGG